MPVSSISFSPPVITGVGVGLPGSPDPFAADGLTRLLNGENLISPISGSLRCALLEKNVVQLKKHKDGNVTKTPIVMEEQTIKLAAQLAPFTLENYGVSKSLSMTMDQATSVAVACGLEAMKAAGLLKKDGSWELEEKYREATGVIYITSFPGLDATVEEVMRFLQSKTVAACNSERLVEALRARFLRASVNRQLSDEVREGMARCPGRPVRLVLSPSAAEVHSLTIRFVPPPVFLPRMSSVSQDFCRGQRRREKTL